MQHRRGPFSLHTAHIHSTIFHTFLPHQHQVTQCHALTHTSFLTHFHIFCLNVHQPQVTQRPGGPLTPAQLDRIKELLVTQHNGIAADAAELDVLCSQLEAWRLEHPEVDLPARLTRLGTVV